MPTKRTLSPSLACTAAKAGSSFLHGAQVEYQKLTTSGLPDEIRGWRRRRRRVSARSTWEAVGR